MGWRELDNLVCDRAQCWHLDRESAASTEGIRQVLPPHTAVNVRDEIEDAWKHSTIQCQQALQQTDGSLYCRG